MHVMMRFLCPENETRSTELRELVTRLTVEKEDFSAKLVDSNASVKSLEAQATELSRTNEELERKVKFKFYTSRYIKRYS